MNLFDLRRIIGGVFLAWGLLLVILGLTGSEAETTKAAGININLWAGLGMFVVGAGFLTWALVRPLFSEQAGGAAGGDGEGAGRGLDAGREERED